MTLAFVRCFFCLSASAFYIINDQVAIERDRLHPRKRERPLASGSARALGRRRRDHAPRAGARHHLARQPR